MASPALLAPAHPWQRTLRTAVQALVGLLAMLPLLVAASGLDQTLPAVAGVLAIATALSRVMALPQTEAFLRRFAPWLSASDVPSSQVVAQVVKGQVVAGEAHPAKTGRKVKTPAVDDDPPEGD